MNKVARLYIGMNGSVQVTGSADSKKLLEDIPNKVQTTIRIIMNVNLLSSNIKDYLEIYVSPSSYQVS